MYKFVKRRFDVLAAKDKSHADTLSGVKNEMGEMKKSLKAIQRTVQAEKATQLSDEVLGLPFKSMTEVDLALANPGHKVKLFEVISTIEKNKDFISNVHAKLLDPDFIKHCYVSNQM